MQTAHGSALTASLRVLAGIAAALVISNGPARAQVTMRPAERPIVTAEHEAWFLQGEPITFAGNVYYPAGPEVFFNQYEMTRTGSFRGIPLYSLKTREPYSVVFVPVAGGLMQPYERRREGDVAGTTGSTAPSFPVQRDVESEASFPPAAAGPPTGRDGLGSYAPTGDVYPSPGRPAATVGTRASATPPLTSLSTAQAPLGLNAFFIEYEGQRWFSSGPVVEREGSSFVRAGEYHGFPVYVQKDHPGDTIYVPVAGAVTDLLTPYSLRK
jgi:hypothetical protein